MTTFREVCGGLRGMLAHQAADEAPCGWCAQAERAAFLAAEASHPMPPDPGFLPVTEEEAAANRAMLLAELQAYGWDHPGASSRGTGHRHLRRIA